ncbi:MAG: thiamine diphosphokinase [Erysipelotrichaceae bacterium]|nr:thiamine diphosphokinase [Erysipelotrichaceae bacterium]
MVKALLVASLAKHIPTDHFDFVIGVDRGALICVQKGMIMDLAIGDFDSVSKEELEIIGLHSKKIVMLDVIKDVTDSQAAMAYVESFDEVVLCGGLGGRIDHQLINIGLVRNDIRLSLWDENHLMYTVIGDKIIKKAGYRYLSLFACESSIVHLSGVKYPLNSRSINEDDLYLVSNEIIEEEAYLSVKGKVLIIQSNDA